MDREDVKTRFGNIKDELGKLHRDRKETIRLAKATYAGLRKVIHKNITSGFQIG